MPKTRNTNVVAAYLVLMKDNKVLLLQRQNTGYNDGKYSVIAGHVEKGETFTDTIIREAKEEAGITLHRDKIKVAHVQHRKSDSDASERVHTYFISTEWEGEIENTEPDKCSDLSWFNLNKLPSDTIECVECAIRNIQKNIFYSEFGW